MVKFTCTKVLFRIIHGRKKLKIPIKFYVHIIVLSGGLLSIMFDEEEIINITNQWLFHIRYLNKEHIIQPYNVTIFNVP